MEYLHFSYEYGIDYPTPVGFGNVSFDGNDLLTFTGSVSFYYGSEPNDYDSPGYTELYVGYQRLGDDSPSLISTAVVDNRDWVPQFGSSPVATGDGQYLVYQMGDCAFCEGSVSPPMHSQFLQIGASLRGGPVSGPVTSSSGLAPTITQTSLDW